MMHKVTYWISYHSDESFAHLRAKTRKECKRLIETSGCDKEEYSKPIKVWIEYLNAIDLINEILGEGGEEMAVYLSTCDPNEAT